MNKGLELLKFNHAGAMRLKDGRTVNYGVIKVINDDKVLYYTGKGLREMWAPDMTEEQKVEAEILKGKEKEELMETGHVAITPLDDIERVLF